MRHCNAIFFSWSMRGERNGREKVLSNKLCRSLSTEEPLPSMEAFLGQS